jgi:hypothetical protein
MRYAAATLLALLAGSSSAMGQYVTVRLTEPGNGRPVAGAVVRLLDEEKVVGQSLTGANGQARLTPPRAGTYRLKISRIGYLPLLQDLEVPADRSIVVTLPMTSSPVSLPPVVAEAKAECKAYSDESALVGLLWEQVSTALSANAETNRSLATPLRVREFRRELKTDGSLVKEITISDGVRRGRPYAAVAPSVLADSGYARTIGDEMTFSAPDADVLLSDEFAGTHCFKAVGGDADSIVGLAFEPLPRRRETDVKGTLWLNRSTSELKFLEYTYENLPVQLRSLGLGGRVSYERLPAGAWIVDDWRIRMPLMAEPPADYRTKSRTIPHLAGYVEVGGHAELVAATGNRLLRATIIGSVFDSTINAPIVGAVARLAGAKDSVLSDSAGRFVLVSTTGGIRQLVVHHPKLDLLPGASEKEVELSLGHSILETFVVPSANSMAAGLCGDVTGRSGVIGIVTDSSDIPMESAEIDATWLDDLGSRHGENSQAGPGGLFVICDIPASRSVAIRVLVNGQTLVEKAVTLEPSQFTWAKLSPER